jgi:alpha-amylase
MADTLAGAQCGGLPVHQRRIPNYLQRSGTRTPHLHVPPSELTPQGLTGGEDPHNREATWNHGFSTSSPYFSFFKKLNHGRRKAITAYPGYFKSLLKINLLNTHTVSISKSPFLTILSNVGSRSPPVVLHITSDKTGYKALMPVIDILSGHVYATDPKGSLTVVIIAGEPRVFLPLSVYRSQGIVPKESWLAGLTVNTDIVTPNGAGSKSPPSAHRKNGSIGRGRMFGLFGHKK